MTREEALSLITAAIAPKQLSHLQINIFYAAWEQQSYSVMAKQLNHEYSYIKDVGAELWQLLTQILEVRVTKRNLQDALCQYRLLQKNDQVAPRPDRVDWGEVPDVSRFYGRQSQLILLTQWLLQDRCRMVAITGIGGIGKTLLAARLTQQIVDAGQFQIILWRSLQQAPPLVE